MALNIFAQCDKLKNLSWFQRKYFGDNMNFQVSYVETSINNKCFVFIQSLNGRFINLGFLRMSDEEWQLWSYTDKKMIDSLESMSLFEMVEKINLHVKLSSEIDL